jgi:hypothetical protein
MAEASAPAAGPPRLAEALSWVGAEIDDVGGARVGRVRALFVDAANSEPSWAIVRLGRRFPLFGRSAGLVAVPLRDCAAGAARVWTAHRGESLRAAPTVDPTRPLLREHEITICAHYGIGERMGRAAEVVERPQGAVTSRPV